MPANYISKVASRGAASVWAEAWKADGKKIGFTNGCFDLLHPGHIQLLHEAKELGNRLVVGFNANISVFRLKGNIRAIPLLENYFYQRDFKREPVELVTVDQVFYTITEHIEHFYEK